MKINLVQDWKVIIRKAWSMRLTAFGLLLGFLDQLIPQLDGVIDKNIYLALLGAIAIARIIQQEEVSGKSKK